MRGLLGRPEVPEGLPGEAPLLEGAPVQYRETLSSLLCQIANEVKPATAATTRNLWVLSATLVWASWRGSTFDF